MKKQITVITNHKMHRETRQYLLCDVYIYNESHSIIYMCKDCPVKHINDDFIIKKIKERERCSATEEIYYIVNYDIFTN